MTDTLLCIGGPCDGQRYTAAIEDSQTLILYVRPKVPFPPRIGAPFEEPAPETVIRAIYSRQAIHFGGGASVDFWVHESLSAQQALMKIMGCYKGDAE